MVRRPLRMDLTVEARWIVPCRCLGVLVELSGVAHGTRVVRQAVSRPAIAVMAVVRAGGPLLVIREFTLIGGSGSTAGRCGADSAAWLSPGEATVSLVGTARARRKALEGNGDLA